MCITLLRLKGELPEATDKLYVADRNDKLIGEIALSRLVTVDPSKVVSDIMSLDIVSIPVDMDETEAANHLNVTTGFHARCRRSNNLLVELPSMTWLISFARMLNTRC